MNSMKRSGICGRVHAGRRRGEIPVSVRSRSRAPTISTGTIRQRQRPSPLPLVRSAHPTVRGKSRRVPPADLGRWPDAGRHVFTRAPRVGAAQPPLAHRRELRRVPAPPPRGRAGAARRRVRSRQHHARPRRPGRARAAVLGIDAAADAIAAATEANTAPEHVTFAIGDVYALDAADDDLRRRPRAPGAPAPLGSRRRAARDAARHQAGWRRRGARRRLRVVRVGTGHPAARAVERAVPPDHDPQSGRGRRRPLPPRVGAAGRVHRHRRVELHLDVRRPRVTRVVGWSLGRPRRGSRRSPSRPSSTATPTAPSSTAIAAAWRTWAEQPDGWFAVLHGEILARA